MYHILGLGNPEKKYDGTRHNVGRDVLKTLVNVEAWEGDKHAQALVAHHTLSGERVALILPETYMNRSGETARYYRDKRKVDTKEMIVVYDDVALPLGEVKIATGRGDGGHNGLKSLIGSVGKEFIRVRVGVASTTLWSGQKVDVAGAELSRHVLGKFSFLEKRKVEQASKRAAEALELIVKVGTEQAMNQFNAK